MSPRRFPGTRRAARARRGPLLALAILLGLPLALELGARAWLGDAFAPEVVTEIPLQGCVAFDAELGWRNPPGLRARTVLPSLEQPLFTSQVTINARGLRDRAHALAKPAGVRRVVAVGDSFTWGWGVDDGLAWADLLERDLGPGVEVVNLGVPGFSTDQELLFLEREGVRYAPDLVLLCFALNDVEGNEADFLNGFGKPRLEPDGAGGWRWANLPVANTPEAARRAGAPPSALERLARRLALVRLLRGAPRAVVRPNRLALPDLPPDELRALLRATPWPLPPPDAVPGLLERLDDERSSTRELLRRMAERCRALGVPLVAFSIAPHDPYLTIPGLAEPAAVAEAARAGVPYETRLTQELARAGRSLGFETLSVDQALLDAARAGLNLNNGDGHLSARGNELVARALLPALRARLEGAARAPEGGG